MTQFLHPKYWLSWIGIFFMWAISQFPWRWQMAIGESIGKLLHSLVKSRRDICIRNLEIAFPEKSPEERAVLCKEHFISLGKGLMDASFSWWGSSESLLKRSRIIGVENLDAAIASERPIIFLSTHFTSLEVSGSIIADRLESCFVFRPHQNPLLNHISINRRESRFGKTIAKDHIRDMVRQLKQGKAVWYAPDQNFRGKGHIMVPFFGTDAPTNPATSRLAKLSNALVIPIYCTRESGEHEGYTLHIQHALDNFPSDNINNDTLRINQVIEQQIRAYPEQYLWTHKRYKGCQVDGRDIYNA
ncbi:lysophospholipid acyltransferase family protein [Leucothrix arctica]|uniref:Lipid A biosynthesis lauroyl acyltransferase n=1 Tax=Leucothrix arctica TaxID=1481894 RepID=A0A317C7R7_9GAMM|nr:lysophospholipid acyltransferase family protein [Leucothrix arctica]PWQ94636.1 lipid A biosynthesis lauroyl acyltransferase [Leucothrix arctica]